MIAKEIPKPKKTNTGGIKRLIEYIGRMHTDNPLDVNYSNCIGDTFDISVKEMQAVQSLARQSDTDNKTYHLVLSFHKEDDISPSRLEYMEQEVCKTLGFADHQRASALHLDTDNPHLHIAINKVHPETLRVLTPYRSKMRLLKFADRMQNELDLVKDDLSLKIDRQYTTVAQVEAFSSQQSLHSYVQETVKPAFLNPQDLPKTWQILHNNLAEYGLEIKPYHKGFVIGDSEQDIWVKSSSLISVKHLGDFEERNGEKQSTLKQQYSPQTSEQSDLWDEFNKLKNVSITNRKQQFSDLRETVTGQRSDLQKKYQALRLEIQQSALLSKKQKAELYRKLAAKRKQEAQKITQSYAEQRQQTFGKNPTPQWQKFLIEKAITGNETALKSLMYAKQQRGFKQLINQLKQLDTEQSQQCLAKIEQMTANKQKRTEKQTAIKDWIASRNALVGKTADVIEHQFFGKQTGNFIYRGIRNINDNQAVALLEKDSVIFVKPISDKQKNLLRTITKGSTLTVDEKGFFKTTGKSVSTQSTNKKRGRK